MQVKPSIPLNEALRQAEVERFICFGNSERDPILDQVVRMAADYFGAPIALVSIVDRNRQWFKARVGLNVSETSRDASFCAHALHTPVILEVCDAQRDPRFSGNPLVTGAPGIRYYAGYPLFTNEGLALGSLCIIDTKPREAMPDRDRQMLEAFSRLVLERLYGMRESTFIDASTGLLNRLRLEEDVSHRLQQKERLMVVAAEPVSASAMDGLVKALGFSFATEFSSRAIDLFQQLLPAGCQLYTISHQLYAFAIDQTDVEQAEQLFSRLTAAFSVPLECRGVPVLPQMGIGVLPMRAGDDTGDWVRLAVSAATEARQGGTGWAYYDPRTDKLQQRSTLLLNALAEAVRLPDQLRLVYQPRVDFSTGKCSSVEALIRWTHPVLGEISPGEFIPLAETTASIRQITLWVIRRAVAQAAEWKAAGLNLNVSINISAMDLVDDSLCVALVALFDEYRVDGTAFELEFTESSLVQDFASVRDQLARLRELGLTISIDDFGSGYSNWAHLREIPASVVKLDRSFMGNLLPGQSDWSIVRGLISITRELNLRVVAEGVETELVYHLMRGWGCHEVQGYFIARPMAPDAFVEWHRLRQRPTPLLADISPFEPR
ncbi:bifunctional diguanylate cyclase/phosphodiesterase [Pseudomonas sp. Marseille-QA0892]